MAAVFNRIIEEGYWVAFGSLSAAQQQCKADTADAIDDLFAVRQRERFVHEVKTCVAGYPPADENEPLVPESFSQFQFYIPLERELVSFVDRFDYLICCIANGICKIQPGFEERYARALLNIMTFRTALVPAAPLRVLDESLVADLRRADVVDAGLSKSSPAEQEGKINTYLAKADPFSRAVRDELAQLEAEEAAAEHRRREAADRAAGHNPYAVTDGEASQVADEMTEADISAVHATALQESSIMAQGGLIIKMAPTSSTYPIAAAEDPTPCLSLVLTVKAEEEARRELERRRYERRDRLREEEAAAARAKAEREEAEEADRVKAAEMRIARLQKEREALEQQQAEAQRALEEATRIREIERGRMALQLQQQAAAADRQRLEEANAREARARVEAEKAAKRREEAAGREALAREAAAREARRAELEAGRQAIIREEAAQRIVEAERSRQASTTAEA